MVKTKKKKKTCHVYVFHFPQSFPVVALTRALKPKRFSPARHILNSRQLVRCRGEFSQLLKQWIGGEMHYGRIYIQYFALWSSHSPGGLIVCVFVCVTTILKDSPLHCQCIGSMGSVEQCQRVSNNPHCPKKVPFLQTTADLIKDQYR